MSSAYERKKQPEVVRRALIDCAANLALERGLQAVTVQAVAAAAGVTKGGLFHHFPTKERLIEAVFDAQLDIFGSAIDEAMQDDHSSYGCFTRAYVRATFNLSDQDDNQCGGALAVSMMTDPVLRPRWSIWMRTRLTNHKKTDSAPALEIVRLAADGAWLADLTHLAPDLRMDRKKLLARLVAMTRKD
ncbi:TetR family transcriptional regulator [Rhodopseudomonas sp. BR0M22]|uniref:TetR family transcriptional regulator n=1 Tax=Rhodopseudomonas sp. BR0M22 TaxID=2269369 RepID=UPI0013DFB8DB|nr:TetR family transcriptional regulator [Rhodopseudomonas sp. BR0M22]NEW90582.1 TetR/AcrR family transcriptional regulator [Rhodopseudomonas sp. BR0M22]